MRKEAAALPLPVPFVGLAGDHSPVRFCCHWTLSLSCAHRNLRFLRIGSRNTRANFPNAAEIIHQNEEKFLFFGLLLLTFI